MKPKQIKIEDKTHLLITWSEEIQTKISLKYLRDECPCAGCKGETILFKTFRPPKPAILSPEMYKIKNIEPVGDYAIQISWRDGHNTGIYSWEYLNTIKDGESNNIQQKYDKLI